MAARATGLSLFEDVIPDRDDARRAATPDYLRSLDDWPQATLLATRLSSRLARHAPARAQKMRNDAPIASFTFDDAPESALSKGAALLEERGARGTFYISTALLGRRLEHYAVAGAEAVRAAHRRGHEIGLHGHAHVPAAAHDAAGFARDLAMNAARLRAIDASIDAQNYAYPYGHATLARKFQLAPLARSARSVECGVNHGFVDPLFLRCVELANARIGRAAIDLLLDKALRRCGWIAFLSHDVSGAPSPYGVTPALFSYALDGARRRGFRIETMRDALDLAGLRATTR
jgi:peptidoglycan/xylan/chitin deacetylase (PgdA/CDA1 family)